MGVFGTVISEPYTEGSRGFEGNFFGFGITLMTTFFLDITCVQSLQNGYYRDPKSVVKIFDLGVKKLGLAIIL